MSQASKRCVVFAQDLSCVAYVDQENCVFGTTGGVVWAFSWTLMQRTQLARLSSPVCCALAVAQDCYVGCRDGSVYNMPSTPDSHRGKLCPPTLVTKQATSIVALGVGWSSGQLHLCVATKGGDFLVFREFRSRRSITISRTSVQAQRASLLPEEHDERETLEGRAVREPGNSRKESKGGQSGRGSDASAVGEAVGAAGDTPNAAGASPASSPGDASSPGFSAAAAPPSNAPANPSEPGLEWFQHYELATPTAIASTRDSFVALCTEDMKFRWIGLHTRREMLCVDLPGNFARAVHVYTRRKQNSDVRFALVGLNGCNGYGNDIHAINLTTGELVPIFSGFRGQIRGVLGEAFYIFVCTAAELVVLRAIDRHSIKKIYSLELDDKDVLVEKAVFRVVSRCQDSLEVLLLIQASKGRYGRAHISVSGQSSAFVRPDSSPLGAEVHPADEKIGEERRSSLVRGPGSSTDTARRASLTAADGITPWSEEQVDLQFIWSS